MDPHGSPLRAVSEFVSRMSWISSPGSEVRLLSPLPFPPQLEFVSRVWNWSPSPLSPRETGRHVYRLPQPCNGEQSTPKVNSEKFLGSETHDLCFILKFIF